MAGGLETALEHRFHLLFEVLVGAHQANANRGFNRLGAPGPERAEHDQFGRDIEPEQGLIAPDATDAFHEPVEPVLQERRLARRFVRRPEPLLHHGLQFLDDIRLRNARVKQRAAPVRMPPNQELPLQLIDQQQSFLDFLYGFLH